jgi:uncharacterized protein YndB with AHSA1/START domain
MNHQFDVKQTVLINASSARVWDALINNSSAEERVHSEDGWRMMLETLKKVLEE